ncbi:hypothetical protein E4U33_006576 [Claviceps sp. LM78 group G4]|nr:hypothetical protein E4U33_006576 [Claviceps sp. LM78 group G4]
MRPLLRMLVSTTASEAVHILQSSDRLGVKFNGTYERGMVRYRTLLDAYKVRQHKYAKEVTGIDTITQLIQSTVARHSEDSCCDPDDPLQQWIANIKRCIGIDDRVEKKSARKRYKATDSSADAKPKPMGYISGTRLPK